METAKPLTVWATPPRKNERGPEWVSMVHPTQPGVAVCRVYGLSKQECLDRATIIVRAFGGQ